MNDHVLAFARTHRLRHRRLADNEVVLPLGPRKRAASEKNQLGAHAWHAGGTTWRVFLQSARTEATAKDFERLGATVRRMDGELEATIPEDHLLPTLDAMGRLLRPWRKRVATDAQRAAGRTNLARARV